VDKQGVNERSSLDGCCSTFERAEVVARIDGDCDEGVIVLVEEEAADDLIRADIETANTLICVCRQDHHKCQ
jgi:hypothetical protein